MEFSAFRKIPRLFSEIIVTEKIDGTNGAVVIEKHYFGSAIDPFVFSVVFGEEEGQDGLPVFEYHIGAQSRSRLLTLENDNFGFAEWVKTNAAELVQLLGEGRHFGEFFGAKIQRKYGAKEPQFALFNVERFADINLSLIPTLRTVPVLYRGLFSEEKILDCLEELRLKGSKISPGFMSPEGICIFFKQSNLIFKIPFDSNPKGISAAERAKEKKSQLTQRELRERFEIDGMTINYLMG
jgi:hypothetical protein